MTEASVLCERVKKSYRKARSSVYAVYGNICNCCGEDEEKFLSIDHVNDDGAAHRKQFTSQRQMYVHIIKENYSDTFQLLCRNCNWGRYVNNGICPHKTE